jgi:ferritin-like protein
MADGPVLDAHDPGPRHDDKELLMPQGSTTFHESEERLSTRTRDMHRAIVSLMEELEAIDWYQQRIDATDDPELREILRHNRDEEKEHAAMVLEWIRRRDDRFSAVLKTYLFSEGSITELEDVVEKGNGARMPSGLRASIGSLRGGAR